MAYCAAKFHKDFTGSENTSTIIEQAVSSAPTPAPSTAHFIV